MLTLFDIGALTFASLGAFYFVLNRNSIVICLNLFTHFALSFINLAYLNEYYYIVISIFELLFIALGLTMRVKTSILIIFLISLSYNAISFIEFNTEFSFIYNNYELVMKSLIVSLIFLIFKCGYSDGINNSHNLSGNSDKSDYSRVFCRSSQ